VELNVDDCVHWYGFIDEDDLVKVYQSSDLFVLCTREEKEEKSVEGFGLVFLEAQSCGIPVIGTNQGGIPDAIKHENGGWIIQRDDMKTLSNYFNELTTETDKFKKQGIKARQRVIKKATWNHFGEKVFKIVEKTKD